MRRLRRPVALLALLVALVGGAVPAPAYVTLANGDFDQHYVYRDVGSTFLTGAWSATYQIWIISDRAARFQTYLSSGPSTFTGGNDYMVTFDGDGGVSNNMAVGAEGVDTYSTVLPSVGSWMQHGWKHTAGAGSTWDHTFYYQLQTNTNNVVRNSSADFTWPAGNRLIVSNNFWNPDAEGTNGRFRCVKIFSAALSAVDLQTESGSCPAVTAAGIANLWAQWKLCTTLTDSSGNGRDLSANGTNSFTDDGCSARPLFRQAEPLTGAGGGGSFFKDPLQ